MDLLLNYLPVIVCGVCGNFHRSSQIAQKCDPEHPYYLFLTPTESVSSIYNFFYMFEETAR